MTVMPVTPALLVWAREHRGLTLDAAATLLGMTGAELTAFEAGAPLLLAAFRQISAKYRIPGATLLRRTPPRVQPMPRDFRTVDGRGAVVGFETRLAIEYARTLGQNIIELVEAGVGPATPALPRIQRNEDPAEAGERERERLGVPIVNQFAWRATDAFNIWRAIIERAGCFVLLQKFDLNQCKGFSLFENPNTPIIVISKAESNEPARTFTLVHEYAHILLREPGISDQHMGNPVEAYCNRFAAGFLMPRAALRVLLPGWPNNPVEWDRGQVREWAAQLKVSQQALALRLEELNVAPAGFFGRIVAGQHRAERRESAGGNYVNTQMFEMGSRYLSAVFSATDAGAIKAAEATEMTQLAPRHFEAVRLQVEQKFERAGAAVGGIPH